MFYTPYLSDPDPSVKRASGFLMPTFGNSNTNGFHIAIPYYLVLGPDKDLTLAPRFTTTAGQLLAAEYRQRFGNGTLDADRQHQLQQCRVRQLTRTPASQWRGHVNASGVWDIDDTYRTGFALQRVSDQTYLLRFGFGNPLLERDDQPRLSRRLRAARLTDVNAYMFQPLLPGLGDSTQPIVLPVANRNWQSEPDGLGGVWKLNANLLDIVREVGTQTRRLSLGSEWDKTFRDGIGGRIQIHREPARRRLLGQRSEPPVEPRSAERFFPGERRAAGATASATIISTGASFRSSG